jgi:hypothetical protein
MTLFTQDGELIQHRASSGRQVHSGACEMHTNHVTFICGAEVSESLAVGDPKILEQGGSLDIYDAEIHDPSGEGRKAKVSLVAPTRVGPNNVDPPSTSADYTIILPSDVTGVTNKVLQVTGISGRILTTEWANYSSDPMNVRDLELKEDPANGTNKITLQAPTSLGSDYTLILPTGAPALNQFLKCSNAGSGAMVWANEPTPTPAPAACTVNAHWYRVDTNAHWYSYSMGGGSGVWYYPRTNSYSPSRTSHTYSVLGKKNGYTPVGNTSIDSSISYYTSQYGICVYNSTGTTLTISVQAEAEWGLSSSNNTRVQCATYLDGQTWSSATNPPSSWSPSFSNGSSGVVNRYFDYTGSGYPAYWTRQKSDVWSSTIGHGQAMFFAASQWCYCESGTIYSVPENWSISIALCRSSEANSGYEKQYLWTGTRR